MNNSDKARFWANLGEGLCIFLICLGIGTCSVMTFNVRINIETGETPKVEKVDKH